MSRDDAKWEREQKAQRLQKLKTEITNMSLDEAIVESATVALKYDSEKVDMSLIPIGPLMAVARVWTFGKAKYSAWNWTKGFAWSRPYAAALRHIFAWAAGENKDPETGESHLAHAICCLTMLIEFQETNTGADDRYKRQAPKEEQ